MTLNAPSMVVYIIALLVAIVGLLAYFGVFGAIATYAFWLMALAFVVLAGAVLVKAA